jgi:cytochrome c oxidase cbb3-type subunit 3/ubiquinol-cytochrome c reductase cytochrome c subunit
LALACTGCAHGPEAPAPRPDQVLDFATLYAQNCAACHGAEGKLGAAVSLANPVYIATAGAANIQRITAQGVPNTLMPPFAKASGGMLTDQQVGVITQGIVTWGKSQQPAPYAYAAGSAGNAAEGQKDFDTYCSKCHKPDSLTDPAYLALISDQALRSLIIAGEPDQGMPPASGITERQITDTVAWLSSKRTPQGP